MLAQRLMAVGVEARAAGESQVSAILMALSAIVARREAPEAVAPSVVFSAVGEGPALVYVFRVPNAQRFAAVEASELVPAVGAEIDAEANLTEPTRLLRWTDDGGIDVVVAPESFDAFTRHLAARGVAFGETFAYVDALPTGDAVTAQLPWMR